MPEKLRKIIAECDLKEDKNLYLFFELFGQKLFLDLFGNQRHLEIGADYETLLKMIKRVNIEVFPIKVA